MGEEGGGAFEAACFKSCDKEGCEILGEMARLECLPLLLGLS